MSQVSCDGAASPPADLGAPERLARAGLSRVSEPGDPRVLALVEELGAREVWALLQEGHDLGGLFPDAAARLVGVDPAGELERARSLGIRFVVPGDGEWPLGLGSLTDVAPLHRRGGVPLGLWVKGPLPLSAATGAVSIVGSRSATTYGTTVAGELAAGAARAGHVVVSGAAFGIDQAAHRGALAVRGGTVAVLACGVDRAYPRAHSALLTRLGEVGAVASELPIGCSPTRIRFLARNRIIAAMSRATVVVEAAVRSGALNTANWADRLHRPVLGVPGPVTSAASQGVHQLIRSGAATLATSAAEVLEAVGEAGQHLVEPARAPEGPRDRLPLREQQILDAVPLASMAPPCSIARTSGVQEGEVVRGLENLRLRGLVESVGGQWRLASAARPPSPTG